MPNGQPAEDDARLPLTEHLDELRKRLIRSAAAMGVGAALCYNWKEEIFAALMAPLSRSLPGSSHMIFTELTEAFLTYFKVALWGGFVLACPVIFHQLWRFVAPGLYRKERSYVVRFAAWSACGFLAGIAFGYFVAVPPIFAFLLGFGRTIIVPMPSMKESLSLILRLLLAFGIMFELPLVLYLGGRAGILTPAFLRKGRKFAVLGVFLLAAVLTPPDVVSQVVVAVPLYALYEIGILACALSVRSKSTIVVGESPRREDDPGGTR